MSREDKQRPLDAYDLEQLSNGDPIRNIATREVYEQNNDAATRMHNGKWEAIVIDRPWEWELADAPHPCSECGCQVIKDHPCRYCGDSQGSLIP